MEFRSIVLENGLEIVAECNPRAYSCGLGFFVKAGSRDESDQNHGVSHFLEHMTFKGTPSRTAADVNRELDEIGSHSNAFTTEEQTVYFVAILPEYQDRALELLCDILRPSLREEDFQIEKQVILEEIAKYEDQPPFGAHEKCMQEHFGKHPLGRSILGTTGSVAALTRTQMLDYFRQRYSPRNIVLAAAGNVDFPRLVDQTRRWTEAWQVFDAPRSVTRARGCNNSAVVHKPAAVQEYVVQIADGPAAEDDDRYAGRLLATIVGDESGSRMFWNLVDTGWAEYAATNASEYQGTGIYMTYLCCAPEDAQRNLDCLEQIYREVQRDGVGEAELVQAKSKVCSYIVLQSERPLNRMFSVGSGWIANREYLTVRELLDRYQTLSVRDAAAVLERYPLTPHTTLAVGPRGDDAR